MNACIAVSSAQTRGEACAPSQGSRWRSLAAALLAGLTLGAYAAGPSPVVADALWLDRLTFGVSEQSLAELRRMGRPAWLAAQLRPASTEVTLPEEAAKPIGAMWLSRESGLDILTEVIDMRSLVRLPPAASTATTTAMTAMTPQPMSAQPASRAASRPQGERDDELRREIRRAANDLRDEAIQRSLLLAVYSPRQVQEMLTWFWFNHFNISPQGHPVLLSMVGDYEQTLRRHALGRFRDLLGAVATHPAMLVYLNNDRNGRDHVNENYARELMELHTLGVDGGYSQQDVQQLAHVLTGLGLRRPIGAAMPARPVGFHGGMSYFYPGRNIPGPKTLLGHTLDAQGWAQIEQALDLLARHPATARHVTRKLARFFIADEPSPELVARLAQRFRDTDGDIAAVMHTLVNSAEFEASLDRKFKDPVRFVVSAIRLVQPPGMALRPQRLQQWLSQMGQAIYGRNTPDGYPLVAAPWSGSGQMARRFDVAQEISTAAHFPDSRREAERLSLQPDSSFSREVLLPALSARTREVLEAAAVRPVEWRALLLSSPEFMMR